jgi:hypothetical protein
MIILEELNGRLDHALAWQLRTPRLLQLVAHIIETEIIP